MSLIYEVNIECDRDIEEAYAEIVLEHKRKILALPGFTGFSWYEEKSEGRAKWAIHYEVETEAHLDSYFNTLAPALRREGPDRFGAKIHVTRRVLSLKSNEFKKSER